VTALPQPAPAQILYGVPFEDYCALPGMNASSLHDISVSPLLYHYNKTHERIDRDSLRLGRATHTATLEPRRFALEYAVWRKSDGVRRSKKWDAFREVNAERTILTELQYWTANSIADAVRAHPRAAALLREGKPEVTILWTHPRTGLPCKSRLDWLCDALVDLKSTRNPTPGKFSSDAARLGYHIKLAFYADACAAAGLGALPVKIISAQNTRPFDVVVFNVTEAALNTGREAYEAALDKYIECKASGVWPGVASEEVDLHLPAWATVEAEEPITFGDEVIA
jgi:hypothetical protein